MANVNVEKTRSREQQRSGLVRRDENFPGTFWRAPSDIVANPFELMRQLTDDLDRVFWGQKGRGGEQGGSQGWTPALEVKEKDGNLIVCAELPGIDQNDVHVEVNNDNLIIQGERKREHEEGSGGFHRTEWSYGTFYRAVPLPEGAKSEDARARFQNGVLEITVPVPALVQKSRRIPIEGTTASSNTASKPVSSQQPQTQAAGQASKAG